MTVTCHTVSTFSYILIYRVVRRHSLQMYTQQQVVKSVDIAPAPGKKGVHITQMKKKCNEHVRILHFFDFMLYSNVHFINSSWTLPYRLNNTVEFHYHSCIYELRHSSIIVLLASPGTSRGSCQDSKEVDM